MQLNSMSSNVSMSGTGATTSFNMDANAKAFRVMSDTLYQNKIGSMVREVSCNAYDSHVMAGCPERQFQIHVPDAYAPFFSVRDFGLGLDDTGVREVFTTYFRSTKDTNNEVVGAFGLGSKTPFAYTDAFTIVAIKDGIKRTYSAFIDATGLPSITILDESNTDEGNGVEIIVPVTASQDFGRFRTEIGEQLAFFPVKPEILNCDGGINWVDWESPNSYMSCENVLVGNNSTAYRGVWIVQGVVGYRMDTHLVAQSLSPENREFLAIIENAALLKFNIGEIEVTPSREGVSYNKFTLANIEKTINSARKNIAPAIQARIDEFEDSFQLACGINEDATLRRMVGITKPKMPENPAYFKTSGKMFMSFENIANIASPMNNIADIDEDSAYDIDFDESDNILSPLVFKLYTKNYTRGRFKYSERGTVKHGDVSADMRIMVRDTANKPQLRIRQWISDINNTKVSTNKVYVLQTRDGSAVTEEQLKIVHERIGSSFEFDFMSDIELTAPAPRINRGYSIPTAYVYKTGESRYNTNTWEREYTKLKDFANGAYYFIVNRHAVAHQYGSNCDCLFLLHDSGLLDRPLVAIRQSDVKKIENDSKWISAEVKGAEVVQSITSNNRMARMYDILSLDKIDMSNFSDNYQIASIIQKACESGQINKTSPLYRVIRFNRFIDNVKNRACRNGMTEIARHVFIRANREPKINNETVYNKIDSLASEIFEMHPLLPFIDSARYIGNSRVNIDAVADKVVEYINHSAEMYNQSLTKVS